MYQLETVQYIHGITIHTHTSVNACQYFHRHCECMVGQSSQPTARPRITPQWPCASVCLCASSMRRHMAPYCSIHIAPYTQLHAHSSMRVDPCHCLPLSVPASSSSLPALLHRIDATATAPTGSREGAVCPVFCASASGVAVPPRGTFHTHISHLHLRFFTKGSFPPLRGVSSFG